MAGTGTLHAAALVLLAACGGAEAPVARAAEGAAAEPVQRATEPGPPAAVLAVDPVLDRAVADLVAAAVECARRESRGRVAPGEVRVAVHARDLDTGEIVLAREDDRPMRPASCLKLVTTASALVLLGPGWSFETGFDALGPVVAGVLEGDLVVRAGGDPLWAGQRAGGARARLDEAARALRERGLAEVAGDLVLDLGTWPDPAPGPEWPDRSQHWQEYCALAAGLTLNGGILATRVRPTRTGEPAAIEVWPADHGLARRYTTTTVAETVNDVRVGATTSAVTVGGGIGRSLDEVRAEFSHPDPVLLFESAWRAALARAGIRVRGATRREHGVQPLGVRLHTLRTPLGEMLEPVNAESVNSVADQVFLATAAAASGRASREEGRAATAAALERLGVSAAGLQQVDGSGLSRANRVTARQLAALVAAVLTSDERTAAAYLGSLAVAGESGTLDGRMRDGPARGRVFAKTGWIAGTSSLAGLARARDGRRYAFAVLVEYPASAAGLNTRCFKPMHDAIAERIVTRAAAAVPREAAVR